MKTPPKSKALLRESAKPLRSRRVGRRNADQPHLPLDPMPERVEPCLALLKSRPPKGDKWAFELKWDGYRLAIHSEPHGVRIVTRGGHDWTHRFPLIAAAAKGLGTTFILDGEAVVFDEEGRSDFGLLQQSLGGRAGRRTSEEAVFMAFDLLYLDGHDIRGMELSARRHLLEGLVPKAEEGTMRLSEELEADGGTLLRLAYDHGLEGIIAKDRDSLYRSGRSGDWLKIKCVQSDAFFILGWEQSAAARGQIGSLLLGAWDGGDLVYVGSVGSGLKASEAWRLREMMATITTSRPAFSGLARRKGVTWLEPVLIAEIEYRALTADRKLRHAAYKGLREVQDNAEVYRLA